MLAIVLLSVVLLHSVQESRSAAGTSSASQTCFDGCGISMDNVSSCLSHGWNCAADEFCETYAAGGHLFMQCRDAGTGYANFMNCSLHQHNNDASCDLSQPGHSVRHNCQYCCSDKSCFEKLLNPSYTSSTQYKISINNCYNNCTWGDGSHSCSSQQWKCQQSEFCSVMMTNDDTVYMACEDVQTQGENCVINQLSNRDACKAKLSDPSVNTSGVCRYCCPDHTCVNMYLGMRSHTTTWAVTPTITTTATTTTAGPKTEVSTVPRTTADQSTPSMTDHSCFTTPCPAGADPASCAAGQWTCNNDEFCQVRTYPNGSLIMDCTSTIYSSVCSELLAHLYCPHPDDFLAKGCSKCCPDRKCVDNIISYLKPTTTQATTTAQGTTLTEEAVTTLEDTTTTEQSTTQQITIAESTVQTDVTAECFDGCEGQSIASCLSYNWTCGTNQYCEANITDEGVYKQCVEGIPNFLACNTRYKANAASCDLYSNTHTKGPACSYCCSNKECFEKFVSQSTKPPSTDYHEVTVNRCYNTTCDSDAETCSSIPYWACSDDEFCAMDINNENHVSLKCVNMQSYVQTCGDLTSDAAIQCIMKLTDPSYPVHGVCTYCCRDDNCVGDRLKQIRTTTPPPTTTTSTTPETTTTTESTALSSTTPMTTLLATDTPPSPSPQTSTTVKPGFNSCFTTHCLPGSDFSSCVNGNWACAGQEFCDIHASSMPGSEYLSMRCADNLHYDTLCADTLSCTGPHDFFTKDCHKCCVDRKCVDDVVTIIKTPAPTTTMTTQETSAEPITTTTPTPTLKPATDCRNFQPDDWCNGITSLCSDSHIAQLCPKTCHACDVVSCVDTYDGNCSEDFADRCSENPIQFICQKTCGICDCSDIYQSCEADYSDDCSSAVVRQMCPRTCRACHELTRTSISTTGAKPTTTTEVDTTTTRPTTPPTTLPTTQSTTLAPGGRCYECSGLQCLLSPDGKQCDLGRPNCLTTVNDSGNARQITRKCVDGDYCSKITKNSACLDIEKTLSNVVCEYCCNESDCNRPPGLIPQRGLITYHNATSK